MKKKNKEEIVENALIKKATGYDADEIIEEFVYDEDKNKTVLVKRKKSTKHFSPDVTAIKILLSYYTNQNFDSLESLSDEELLKERDRLLEELINKKKEK